MSNREKAEVSVVGFKNSKYIGVAKKNQKGVKLPSGFGALMDDLYLTCIGNWGQQGGKVQPDGPALLLFPRRQIFYTSRYPTEGIKPQLWCYVFQNEGIRIFGNSKNNNFAILTGINNADTSSVVCFSLGQGGYKITKQYFCKNQQQIWSSVKQIIGVQVPASYRSVKDFLSSQLSGKDLNKNSIIVKQNSKGQVLYLISTQTYEGFGFLMDKNTNKVRQFGFYQDVQNPHSLEFGRKFSYRRLDQHYQQNLMIEEGVFISRDSSLDQKIYNYFSHQKRPQQSSKTSQKYFRQTQEYSNQFIQLNEADQLFGEVNQMIKEYSRLSQIQNGQRILEEGPKRQIQRRTSGEDQQKKKQKEREREMQKQRQRREQQRIEQEKINLMYSNREYDLSEAKTIIEQQVRRKKGKVGYDRILQRSRSRSNEKTLLRKRQNSPYFSKRGNTQRIPYKNYQHTQSPFKNSSPVKYLYLQEQLNRQKTRIYNPGEEKKNYRQPSNNQFRVKQFTIDQQTNRMKQVSLLDRTQRNYGGGQQFILKQQKSVLDAQNMLQIELMKEKQMMQSAKLLQNLRRRDQQKIAEQQHLLLMQKQKILNEMQNFEIKQLATFGSLGTQNLPLHESSAVNLQPRGKKYGKINYTDEQTERYRNTTPVKYSNTTPTKGSSSSYTRIPTSRKSYKYID